MKQLSFINKTCPQEYVHYWKLFIDGAARNNPGPAGVGICLLKNDKLIEKKGFYVGLKTNNQAEYLALLLGLFYLKKYICADDLAMIISDSELLVRQIKGEYKVKNPVLKPLYQVAVQLLHGIHYNIVHVLREENINADNMANVGIDKKIKAPQDFLELLQDHDIQL